MPKKDPQKELLTALLSAFKSLQNQNERLLDIIEDKKSVSQLDGPLKVRTQFSPFVNGD